MSTTISLTGSDVYLYNASLPIAEFRADFTDFQEIVLAGVESFTRGHEENLLKLSPEQAEVWLDLIEETGRTPEGLGMTAHFLYIGQK